MTIASDVGRHRVAELALLFLRLGVTAFGGPAAHIALMEEEVVRKRSWLTPDEFLDLLGVTNLIPGPNSTEMAIHIGFRRAGWLGLVVAGCCFIVPAALITLAFAWAYARFGRVPDVAAVLYGIKPVMIAIVVQALWSLGRSALKTRPLAALGAVSVVAAALGASEIAVLVAAGLAAIVLSPRATPPNPSALFGFGIAGAGSGVATEVGVTSITSGSLFLVFAKIGSLLFGSGYVLLAFLRAELVEQRHWMTEAQLLDAVAVGQVTPGPVFTTATFVGYLLDGLRGAAAATAGIFLPAFVFVGVSGIFLPKLRNARRIGAFLDGLNVASWALMAVVAMQLGRAALLDVVTVVIAAIAGIALVRYKVGSTWLILGGALVGFVSLRLR